MPTLVRYRGDEDFYTGVSFHSSLMDSNILLSVSPRIDVYCSQRKRARISAAFVLGEQQTMPSLEILPDECLFEIFKRVPSIRDRSACACVSKRWLMLQSSIRRSEILQLPSSFNSVNVAEEFSVANKDLMLKNTNLVVKDVVHGEKTIPEIIEVDSGDAEGAIDSEDGYLTRSLEGKKATDIRLAAISIGSAKFGGLGKLLISGSNATHGVTDVGLSAIACGCPSLKVLSLWDIPSITDRAICEIAEGCPRLQKLDLSHCPLITDKALLAIADKCPNLESLTLESCPMIGNEGLQAIGRSCLNFRSVHIKDCFRVGDQGVAGLVAFATGLTKIKLQGVNISDVSLAVIGHYCKSATELSFTGLQHVGERGFWAFGKAGGLKKLKTFTVSSCKGMTDTGLEALGTSCPALKHLHLRRCCFLSDNGLRAFAQASVALESLQLEECNRITEIGIIRSLSICKSKLKTLSLVQCMGIKDLTEGLLLLPSCDSLRSLTIRNCPGFGNHGVDIVGKLCPQLQDVDFSGLTDVCDSGFISLVQNCKAGLVKLNLNGCLNLTDNAVTRLVMLHGESLQLLNLSGCRNVTDEGLKAILANCPLLLELDMSDCSITDEGIVCENELPELQVLSLSGCSQVSEKSLSILGNLSGSLVGLNLQHCNLISNKALGWLRQQMWRCDILT